MAAPEEVSTQFKFKHLMLTAILAGGLFAAVHPAAIADVDDTYLYIEGEGAQDINGDGMATLSEGLFDIDADLLFTEAEARYLHLDHWMDWNAVPVGVGTPVPGWKCMMQCTGWQNGNEIYEPRCKKQSLNNCWVIGSGGSACILGKN